MQLTIRSWPGEACSFVISLQVNQVKHLQFILSVEIVFRSFFSLNEVQAKKKQSLKEIANHLVVAKSIIWYILRKWMIYFDG